MDKFDICNLSESENKILDYDVFDNYYKIRSKNGYNEELNHNIKKEMEAMLNGILITEEEYKQEKSKKEEVQLYLNILQEGSQLYFNKLYKDYNKEKEDTRLYFNKLQEDYNKEKEEAVIYVNNLIKEQNKSMVLYFNKLQEDHNKDKEEATLKFSKLVEEHNNLKEDYNKIKEENNNLIKEHNEEKELNEFAITQNIELIQENSKLHDHIENVEKFLDNFNAIKKRKVND
jgi:hypothetical protein